MQINLHEDIPIFMQIAKATEEAILSGAFPEESQVPSTTEISSQYKINPATIMKGMGILVETHILYKKRGIGMFVQKGAVDAILQQRQEHFFENYIISMLREASKLHITKEALITMIERGIQHVQD